VQGTGSPHRGLPKSDVLTLHIAQTRSPYFQTEVATRKQIRCANITFPLSVLHPLFQYLSFDLVNTHADKHKIRLGVRNPVPRSSLSKARLLCFQSLPVCVLAKRPRLFSDSPSIFSVVKRPVLFSNSQPIFLCCKETCPVLKQSAYFSLS
jgi:hypothetical protein